MAKLIFHSGQGYTYSPEVGKFEVRWGDSNERKFTLLSEAQKFYESLQCEKTIWDCTEPFSELIECHTFE